MSAKPHTHAELFTVKLHYSTSCTEGLAGYVDFCCADQMPRLELLSMAREFNLDVNGCSLWWKDRCGGLREIKDEQDALTMANSVGSSKEMCVRVRIANGGVAQRVGIDSARAHRGHAT